MIKSQILENHKVLKVFFLKDSIVLSVIIFTNIIAPMTFSCISPFFVDVGYSKGLSLSMEGIVFAIFNLCGFIMPSFIVKMISIFGIRTVYTTGMCLLSIGTLMFAVTNEINSGTWFFISTLILRIIQSMGNTMIFTTTYVIIVKYFPKLISSMLSITENGVGIGYTVGPVIGGSLYEYVGYPYPFLVFGIISSLTTVVAFYCISPHSNEDIMKPDDKENMKNMKHLTWSEVIKIKDIWCIAITLVVVGTALSFHESTLAIGGKEINLSYTEVGILFLAIGGMCSIFSPVWEYITSKYFYLNNYLIILGYVSLTLSFFCMSPLSFIEYKPSIILYGLCLSWMGFASSLLYVPAFRQCMSIITKEHGFAESLETLSILAAIYSLSISVGTCLGPSIGSILVENLGYRKSLSVIAILCFSSTIIFFIIYLIPRLFKKCQNGIKNGE